MSPGNRPLKSISSSEVLRHSPLRQPLVSDSPKQNYQATQSSPIATTSSTTPPPPPLPASGSDGQRHQRWQSSSINERRVEEEEEESSRRGGGISKVLMGWKHYVSVQYLENKSSVARDHLANERTYLAWLRTSLSLTSIGVAVTQLFRLSTSLYSSNTNSTTSLSPALKTLNPELDSIINQLITKVEEQSKLIEQLGITSNRDGQKYTKLGKPIGVTFIALGLLFLVLGTHRYFSVQHVLQNGQYPLSRRSISLATFVVASLIVASFAVIVSFGPIS